MSLCVPPRPSAVSLYVCILVYMCINPVIRLQKNESCSQVDENSSSNYKGMNPRKVAEKLLPRAKGRWLLDEFDNYDKRWNNLPTLSR